LKKKFEESSWRKRKSSTHCSLKLKW